MLQSELELGFVGRRTFLASAVGAVFAPHLAPAQDAPIPIVDCHIHLFDQTRPQGAPYSGGGPNREPALPARYRRLASPLGIVGAIEIEASPWIEDNLWVLEVEEPDRMMLGTVGNLQPEKPEFREYLDRYHKNPLFLGIRYGNLWGYNLVQQVNNPVFIDGLKLLEQAGMVLDSANPRQDLLEAIVRVSDKVPGLRIVVDHLPSLMLQAAPGVKPPLDGELKELKQRPSIFVKVSQMMKVSSGKPVTDPAAYKPVLDQIWETFGEDRLIFGSDWPNGESVDNLPAIVRIVKDYFLPKGRQAAEKYFWKNSVAAYRWKPRA